MLLNVCTAAVHFHRHESVGACTGIAPPGWAVLAAEHSVHVDAGADLEVQLLTGMLVLLLRPC